ncbi:MAG: hypothetical protein KatS3mg013_1977 [Actinomycetota bacterium]|nr:MAG: hypothetical protein KatS3mg013_1977 [Actinomycetota bacterium]
MRMLVTERIGQHERVESETLAWLHPTEGIGIGFDERFGDRASGGANR